MIQNCIHAKMEIKQYQCRSTMWDVTEKQACRAVVNSLNETRAQQTLLKVIVEIIKIADSVRALVRGGYQQRALF